MINWNGKIAALMMPGNRKKALAATGLFIFAACVAHSPVLQHWLLELGRDWGPGFVLAAGFLYFAHLHAPRAIVAYEKQAVATQRLADAVQEIIHRESNEHRETQVLVKLLRDELRLLRSEQAEMRDRLLGRTGELFDRLARLEKEKPSRGKT